MLINRTKESKLSHDELCRLLSYDPATGVFTRRVQTSNFTQAGDTAGCLTKRGYVFIKVKYVLYLAHRLAWFYVHGVWPTEIDHINGVKNDNRIMNLREVTKSENQHNRGAKGYRYKRNGWEATISVNHTAIYLGRFATETEARSAYLKAKSIYHPTAPPLDIM